jgi:hypothetical protein
MRSTAITFRQTTNDNIPSLSSRRHLNKFFQTGVPQQITAGFTAGFAMGYAAKKSAKLLTVVLGVLVFAVQSLAFAGEWTWDGSCVSPLIPTTCLVPPRARARARACTHTHTHTHARTHTHTHTHAHRICQDRLGQHEQRL